jgi:glycosyltransferase involved in cell wall biosynthesis
MVAQGRQIFHAATTKGGIALKICHLLNEFWFGGIQETVLSLVLGLPDDEHFVFGHTNGPMSREFNLPGVRMISSAWNRGYTEDPYGMNLAEFVEYNDIDIVHKQMGGGDDSRFLWPLRRPGRLCAVVESMHCPRDCRTPPDIVDHVCVAGNYTMNMQTHSIPTTIVPYGSPRTQATASRMSVREKWGIPPGSFVIGRIGRLSGSKLVHETIVAAVKAKNIIPNLECVIGGSPAQDEGSMYATHIMKACHGYPFIHFVGETENPTERANWIHAMDLVCYPTQGEGFGMIFLEAIHQGVLSVTYDVGANRETLGSAGICVPWNDSMDNRVGDIVDAIVKTHEEVEPSTAHDRTQTMSAIYTPEEYGGRMKAIYRSVMS